MSYHLIACVDSNRGIGKDNLIPWPRLQADLAYFQFVTKNHVVIMGRKTWDSLPKKPLKDRVNIVITGSPTQAKKIESKGGIPALNKLGAVKQAEQYKTDVFIIGGAKIYEMFENEVEFLHLTQLNKNFDCDTFLPETFRQGEVFAEQNITDKKSGLEMHSRVSKAVKKPGIAK